MPSAIDAASGRWPELLGALAGLSPEQLTDTHQPCPACGGEDRYRWDQDDGDGGWYCNQCGGKDHAGGGGNGMDLLTRVTGWDFRQACRRVEQHLGISSTGPGAPAPARPAPAAKPKAKGRPHRIPETPPAGTPPPALGSAVAQFPYGPDRDNPCYWVQRVPQPPKNDKPQKLFVQRTWIDGRWHYPSKRDPFESHWPKPRFIYRLPDLIDSPDAPVLISEGEGKTDAATQLFPDHVCVAWTGGTAGWMHTDWQPLAGRHCTLWPDADDKGRECMAKLAAALLELGCTVQVVNPPDHLPQGWDLANALAEKWTPAIAAESLANRAKPVELPAEPDPVPEPDPESAAPAPEPPRDAPFVCLGFDEGVFYYQPGSTGQVMALSRSSHTGTNLVNIAPLAWWEACFPTKTGVNWLAAASRLFEDQARVGIFSPDRIRGRGAWWDDGRSVLHLGDRLLVDGTIQPITKAPTSRFHYQRLASIDLPDHLDPLCDELGMELIDIASRFHWEVPASGLLLAGFIALAPICGALKWRPHVWLTASAGSGKSAILDRLIGPMLESLALFSEGNTTEAFIRQQLRADAIPVVFDEAESNEKPDRQRIQNILALARVASSSGRGVIGKGSADGAAQRFTIRSMFLLCSISTALKQGADKSRFAQLTLRNPSFMPKAQRIAHWAALEADLDRCCTTENGHRLLLRMVRQIPIIRDSVAVFRRAAAERFDSQRQGDQYGTLLAGAWSLMNSRPATIEDAYQLIDGNNWDAYREQTEADEERCLQHILQHPMRIELERMEVVGGKVFNRVSATTRTVWELVEAMGGSSESQEILPESAEPHLGRIGIRVSGGRLMIANTALGLQRILADTPWAHSWPTVLARLPGAEKAGKVRFKGMSNSSRAVSLPMPKD
jgi:putative DNA primase/helicase